MSKVKTKKMKELKIIKIKDISVDPNQPRQIIKESEIQELADSIDAVGLIQPITLRLENKKYLVVCGERRFRACKLLGRKEIDCFVKEINQEEAFEMQIIENLQRKDVHPLEEAKSFLRLHDRLDIENISVIVGKTTKYVAQRLKLNALITEFQKILLADKMLLKTALLLSTANEELQKFIFIDECTGWEEKTDYLLDHNDVIWHIETGEASLDNVDFNLNDSKLYAIAGACIGCKFNKASENLLFSEENICTNLPCLKIKESKSFLEVLQNITVDFYVKNFSEKKGDEVYIEFVKNAGESILNKNEYSISEHPSFESYEDWLNKDFYTDDDFFREEMAKSDYKEEVTDVYEAELANYELECKSGKVKKAIIIAGHNRGDIIDIILEESKSSKENNSIQNNKEDEILSLKVKEIRNEQLDAEKNWTKIRELLRNDVNLEKICTGDDMDQNIIDFVAHAMISKLSWDGGKRFKKVLLSDTEDVYNIVFTKDWFNVLQKFFMIDVFVSAFQSHETKGSGNEKIYQFIKPFLINEITAIELEQAGITDQRKERVNKKIAILQND